MKRLPIGKQELSKLINEDCVYIDKTEIIYKMIDSGSVYFLSRPRRFGKSLTVSTLKEIFSGNKKLFKGLWIYDKIEWKSWPIIFIDFSKLDYQQQTLYSALDDHLMDIAKKNNIILQKKTVKSKFSELIEALAQDKGVVLLVDEYDKPIIDYIDEPGKAEKNRKTLKYFYSSLKAHNEHIKFLFITGVSKFSKISIFSDINHLNDITLNPKYAVLTGYTEGELDFYFKDYIKEISKKYKGKDIIKEIKNWYNGYSWDGENFVYNPFSILNFFENQKFEDYWFQTGTPTFLLKLLKQRNFNIGRLENISVTSDVFNKYELSNLETIALLFQTGYLTIKNYNASTSKYQLSYPNNEVRFSFERQLLEAFAEKPLGENAILLNDIISALNDNEIDKFIHLLKVLFKNITYPLIDNKENYYHSIFYLVVKLLGFEIETEILTCDGRIDAVIKTEKQIYIIEFKLGTAEEAIAQILEKKYALKYGNERKDIFIIGIGFDGKAKNISEHLVFKE